MRYELFSSLNFGPVTDRQTERQTESDTYEPIMFKGRCAKKESTLIYCNGQNKTAPKILAFLISKEMTELLVPS